MSLKAVIQKFRKINEKIQKEQRGIYNVSFNEKQSTPINADLEAIENAVIDYVVHYIKGYHDIRRDKGLGAEHIKLHLEPNSQGQITLEELLNLGNSIRAYLKIFKEPFIDKDNRKIYEWKNKQDVGFRVVADKMSNRYSQKTIEKYQRGGSQLPLSPFDDIIITFYSDRNLKERMEFKNPLVKEYYKTKDVNSTQENNQTHQTKNSNKYKLKRNKL